MVIVIWLFGKIYNMHQFIDLLKVYGRLIDRIECLFLIRIIKNLDQINATREVV